MGYLTLAKGSRDAQLNRDFLVYQARPAMLLLILATILSFGAAWFLSRHLLAPLLLIGESARKMASGDLSVRAALGRADELGQLAKDFNSMAETLEQGERARDKWLADTSHELRTPVAILQAEIEAIQDGIHKADEATLGILHQEVKRLSRLISGLAALGASPAEDAEHFPLEFESFLQKVVNRFATRFERGDLTLECLESQPVFMLGDPISLETLVSNLMENVVFFTDRGGRVEWSLRSEKGQVFFQIDDTAPGPREENLTKLFDRFFREEISRSRKLGGSGIGLSLCKSIARAHGGNIVASKSPLGGLRIVLTMPMNLVEEQ